ncbi:unnamed protein product, partial [Allacma fusca]
IFGYLSPADLKSCCEVNEFWGSVADRIIFDYQIVWRSLKYVNVRTTNGYKNPKIQERSSSIAAEMDRFSGICRKFRINGPSISPGKSGRLRGTISTKCSRNSCCSIYNGGGVSKHEQIASSSFSKV